MYRYRRFFINSFKRTLAFRASLVFEVLSGFLRCLTVVCIWRAIYGDNQIIQGFSLQDMYTYLIMAELLDSLMQVDTFKEIRDEVRLGKISTDLLLPLQSMYIFVARSLGRIMIKCALFALPVMALTLFTPYLTFPANFFGLLCALLMLVIACLSSTLLYILFGSVSFWIVETSSTIWAVSFLMALLAGKIMPVQFLPEWLSWIMYLTPFVSIFNLPVSLYLGKVPSDMIVFHFIVQIVWVFMLFLLTRLVWNRGLNRLEVVGG